MKRQNFERIFQIVPNRVLIMANKYLERIGGMILGNKGRPMVNFWLRSLAPLNPQWKKVQIRAVVQFSRDCHLIAKRSGIKYLVLYLKASQVLLMQSLGGQILPSTRPLKAAVSRTKKGLPRLIHRDHRVLILKRNRSTVRMWMTLFSLYRVLEFAGSLSVKTITDKGKIIPGEIIVSFQRFVHDHFWTALSVFGSTSLIRQCLTRNHRGKFDLWTQWISSRVPSKYGSTKAMVQFGKNWVNDKVVSALSASMFEIRKSSPSTTPIELPTGEDAMNVSTSIDSLKAAAKAWLKSPLWPDMKQWCEKTGNNHIVSLIEQFAIQLPAVKAALSLGKLGLKEEASGKIRVFAMVDAYTQWILEPLHKAIQRVLRLLPTDGTFDQHAPVKRLLKLVKEDLKKGSRVAGLWSYDLSAATDRLPLQFQKIVLQPGLGIHAAEVWGRLLTDRQYRLKLRVAENQPKRTLFLKYAVGQPMGALSSWVMLALTHHALVQWAWHVVCSDLNLRYSWFNRYAVLGDDIVIGDQRVASVYVHIMESIGVNIGLAKSLISPSGKVAEFAKRLYIPVDASPISLKESVGAWMNIGVFVEFARKWKLDINQALRVADFGYKVRGSLNKNFDKMGLRLRNLLLVLSQPSSYQGVSSWQKWFQLKGWNRLGRLRSPELLQSVRDLQVKRLEDKVRAMESDSRIIFQLMLLKRAVDRGNRTDYAKYYPLYEMILNTYDGYTYSIAQLKKEITVLKTMKFEWNVINTAFDIERRLDLLPRLRDFEVKLTSENLSVRSSKFLRAWVKSRRFSLGVAPKVVHERTKRINQRGKE